MVLQSWDAQRLSRSPGSLRNAQGFPGDSPHHLDQPTLVTDKWGNTLVWVLPDCLGLAMQATVMAGTAHLGNRLKTTGDRLKNWRTNTSSFKTPNPHLTMKPGVLDLVPAWYSQGHQVRTSVFTHTHLILTAFTGT